MWSEKGPYQATSQAARRARRWRREEVDRKETRGGLGGSSAGEEGGRTLPGRAEVADTTLAEAGAHKEAFLLGVVVLAGNIVAGFELGEERPVGMAAGELVEAGAVSELVPSAVAGRSTAADPAVVRAAGQGIRRGLETEGGAVGRTPDGLAEAEATLEAAEGRMSSVQAGLEEVRPEERQRTLVEGEGQHSSPAGLEERQDRRLQHESDADGHRPVSNERRPTDGVSLSSKGAHSQAGYPAGTAPWDIKVCGDTSPYTHRAY